MCLFCLMRLCLFWLMRQNKIHGFIWADQDWIGLMIFKKFADQDWIGFNFSGSGLDLDWKISQSVHLWKPIAVAYVKVTDQPWRIIYSLYKTLMSKTFLQESSEAFLNLKSLHYAEQKNFTSVFSQSALKNTSKKRHGFIWLLQKETFWHSPTFFE